jgi:hypothetical protein
MRRLRIVCFAVFFIAAAIVTGCDSAGGDAPTAPSKPPEGTAAAPEVPKGAIKVMPGKTVKGGPTPNAP